jgi:hypothetical protein
MKMKKVSLILLSLLLLCLGSAFANVWIDENFDGTGPSSPTYWVQGDGQGPSVSPTDSTLDLYNSSWAVGGAPGPLGGVTITASSLTQTGAQVTTKYFDPTSCYEIESGELVSVGRNIIAPANGAFVILQFGVNVDPIPAAGTVGIVRYDWDTDTTSGSSPDYSFYVKLVSDGAKVDLIAGEDVTNSSSPPESTIGSLTSATEWKFVTMVMQNNTGSAVYTHANLPGGSLTQNEGMAFYCSGTAPYFIAMSGNGGNKHFEGLSFSASNGTIYIDTLYWEGGMDNTTYVITSEINIRKFDYAGSPSSVGDWNLY